MSHTRPPGVAVIALTYSLAQSLNDRGIRVKLRGAGAGMDAIDTGHQGHRPNRFVPWAHTPMGRPAQPDETAPFFGQMSSYHSGEVLAPIGGETLPG